jgi:hypothetical protein
MIAATMECQEGEAVQTQVSCGGGWGFLYGRRAEKCAAWLDWTRVLDCFDRCRVSRLGGGIKGQGVAVGASSTSPGCSIWRVAVSKRNLCSNWRV